jgi:hypothetical protein
MSDHDPAATQAAHTPRATRRVVLRAGLGAAAAVGGGGVTGCAPSLSSAGRGAAMPVNEPVNESIARLDAIDVANGGSDPFPIPWLDRNGSHNQSPDPEMEPSNIFHFRGRVARSNDFTGMGTDQDGRRLAFGAKSTDFSFMHGEYFAGREARRGAFGHI